MNGHRLGRLRVGLPHKFAISCLKLLLFAPTKEQLQTMMCDFKRTEKVGLKIHPGKTKMKRNGD